MFSIARFPIWNKKVSSLCALLLNYIQLKLLLIGVNFYYISQNAFRDNIKSSLEFASKNNSPVV